MLLLSRKYEHLNDSKKVNVNDDGDKQTNHCVV